MSNLVKSGLKWSFANSRGEPFLAEALPLMIPYALVWFHDIHDSPVWGFVYEAAVNPGSGVVVRVADVTAQEVKRIHTRPNERIYVADLPQHGIGTLFRRPVLQAGERLDLDVLFESVVTDLESSGYSEAAHAIREARETAHRHESKAGRAARELAGFGTTAPAESGWNALRAANPTHDGYAQRFTDLPLAKQAEYMRFANGVLSGITTLEGETQIQSDDGNIYYALGLKRATWQAGQPGWTKK